MVSYIIDASVGISRIIREPSTPNAISLFRQYRLTDNYIVPEFCRLECVNVLWKQVRFQGMPLSQAQQNIVDLMALPLKVVPVDALYDDALQIGTTHQLAIYDSVYIALAKHLGYALLSVDQPQIRAASLESVTTKPITDFKP